MRHASPITGSPVPPYLARSPERRRAYALMIERRQHRKGSLDYQWRTRAAWKHVLLGMGVPTSQWRDAPARFTGEQQ